MIRKNHHTFQPLLYQVATAGLSPGEIAMPIRGILGKYRNIEVLLGEVTDIDLKNKLLHLPPNELAGDRESAAKLHDYLILATGASHNYFSHPEWAPLAPGLKTIEDATEIRRRVLLAFELAERSARLNPNPGPSISSSSAEAPPMNSRAPWSRSPAASSPPISGTSIPSALVFSSSKLVRESCQLSEDLSHSAERQLRKLGVEVMVNAMVTNVTHDHVEIGS